MIVFVKVIYLNLRYCTLEAFGKKILVVELADPDYSFPLLLSVLRWPWMTFMLVGINLQISHVILKEFLTNSLLLFIPFLKQK